MSLFAPELIDVDPPDPEDHVRLAFLAGIKAAFLVSQLNRLGQILCSGCGHAWNELSCAFDDLSLRPVSTGASGFAGEHDMGIDHPNNLVVVCWRCVERMSNPK